MFRLNLFIAYPFACRVLCLAAVYPPRSMDGEEYQWRFDDAALGGFMSNYAPVPNHLRRRKKTANTSCVISDGDDIVDLEKDADAAGVEEEGGVENETLAVPDSSAEILLNKGPQLGPSAGPADACKRIRRRLVKKTLHVGVAEEVGEEVGTTFEDSALNVPVRVY